MSIIIFLLVSSVLVQAVGGEFGSSLLKQKLPKEKFVKFGLLSDKELRIYIKGFEEALKYLSRDVSWTEKRIRDYEEIVNLSENELHLFPDIVTLSILKGYKEYLEADFEELKKEASKRFETSS